MNEEYLWDRSGEPDPEIQQLEEMLSTLRCETRPWQEPKNLKVRRRRYLPLLAIAASVTLALSAAGLWLRVRTWKAPPPQQAGREQPVALPSESTQLDPPMLANREEAKVSNDDRSTPAGDRSSPPRRVIAGNPGRGRAARASRLGTRAQQEALAAREQLLMALRLASEKLNLAQRRVQSPVPPNQIRNQHKAG